MKNISETGGLYSFSCTKIGCNGNGKQIQSRVVRNERMRIRRNVRVAVYTIIGVSLLIAVTSTWTWKLYNGDTSLRGRRLMNNNYPDEVFSLEALRNGAILLHCLGIVYLFAGIAIVADEFFVPALDCITEDMKIGQDVAGATFMAAGGSAPELFTSFIGVFISSNNVGIGTIVGSAAFNILFVIGMCAVFSREVLTLTWWPLFRDSCFYSLDLFLLAICFEDKTITWVEALLLFMCYLVYVIFMSQNERVYKFIKRNMVKAKGRGGKGLKKFQSSRAGAILNKAWDMRTKMRVELGTFKWLFTAKRLSPAVRTHGRRLSKEGDVENIAQVMPYPSKEPKRASNGGEQMTVICNNRDEKLNADGSAKIDIATSSDDQLFINATVQVAEDEEEETPFEPIWPEALQERILFLILAPLTLGMYYTNPDPRRKGWRHWYPVTFFMSILWIGGLSYLMVWWAETVGNVIGLSPEIMGMTVLAAGTSIPDLITSVIVARQGFGDMAVSSSIGSNIFDVTVGLPLPWLIYTLTYGHSITVDSNALFFSVLALLLMLVIVIFIIAVSKWRMTKSLGVSMFVLYIVFVVINLINEAGVFSTGV